MTLVKVALFWVAYVAILLATSMLKAMVPASMAQLVWGGASAILLLGLTTALLRRDGKTLAEVGARPSASGVGRVCFGLACGLAMYSVHLLVITFLGGSLGLSRNPAVGLEGLLLAVATFLALSAMEELGFRGYPLRTLATAFGASRALIITSVVFGLSHLLFGWSWFLVVVGVIPGALVFGAAALATGGLAVPIGVHAAWNLASWSTGDKGEPGLWTTNVTAAQRVEAVGSVSYAATMLVGAALFWWWYRRHRAGTL